MIQINLKEHLIHIKSKDGTWQEKTWDIEQIEKNGNHIEVKFNKSSQIYKYGDNRIRFDKSPKKIKLGDIFIEYNGIVQNNVKEAYEFKNYTVIYSMKDFRKVLDNSQVRLVKSCLNDGDIDKIFSYQKELSSFLDKKDNDKPFLQKELENMDFLSRESALASYLKSDNILTENPDDFLIYPFGINASQKRAVETAFENKMCIIQGPPGTGKTQTILNIIANVLYRNETVAIVSGNNSATANVYEKLEKHGYDFLAAPLGNQENIKNFMSNGEKEKKFIDHWLIKDHVFEKSKTDAVNELKAISEQLNLLNRKQQLLDKKTQLKTEKKHYLKRKNVKPINVKKYVLMGTWQSSQILNLILELEALEMRSVEIGILDRVKLFLKYKFIRFRITKDELALLIPAMQAFYYDKAIEECENEIIDIGVVLKSKKFEELMESFRLLSHELMKHMSYERRIRTEHKSFTEKEYKRNFKDFIDKYPIILSTTHSIRRCIPNGYLFDVLIIDEASQVDLLTATIAMSCCRRLVIVGDPMQLSHIVPYNLKSINEVLVGKYGINDAYNYEKSNIIDSLNQIYKENLPVTLLKEHYRCHPQIIRFCNQKYYDDELIIMTKENEKDNRLKLVKTVIGNHERQGKSGWINQRQLEVIRDEVLPLIEYKDHEIGIVTPYREQVELGKKLIERENLLIDTVHKFQGREKESLIISTVKRTPDVFSDDKRLINVAVSRAVSELNVVIGADFYAKHGSHTGDLVKYIEYVAGDAGIYESKKVSIFDCLYKEYSELLIPLIRKMQHISKYKSENLMYSLMCKVLEENERFNSLSVVLHFPLLFLIHDQSKLSKREYEYVNNPLTHVDFVIFNKLNKEPVLIIEVDGYSNHDMNPVQRERDQIKDKVLKEAHYKLMRFSTIGSEEEKRFIEGLDEVVCN